MNNPAGEVTESAWNMALAYMMRLDKILQDMNHYASIGDNYNWWKSCLALYRELIPKFKKNKEMVKLHQIHYTNLIKKINMDNTNAAIGYQRPDYSNLFVELHEWDTSLRSTMEDLKLISPSRDDPGRALR